MHPHFLPTPPPNGGPPPPLGKQRAAGSSTLPAFQNRSDFLIPEPITLALALIYRDSVCPIFPHCISVMWRFPGRPGASIFFWPTGMDESYEVSSFFDRLCEARVLMVPPIGSLTTPCLAFCSNQTGLTYWKEVRPPPSFFYIFGAVGVCVCPYPFWGSPMTLRLNSLTELFGEPLFEAKTEPP